MICPHCGKDTDIKEVKEEPVLQEGVAVPKVFEYRERFVKHALRGEDVKAQGRPRELKRADQNLDGFKYKGENLFFGEGVNEEI